MLLMHWSEQSIDRLYALTGSKIRQARTRREWSQADLAAEVGLTRSSIANVEAGRQKLPVHGLLRIAGALNVRPDSLLPALDELGMSTPQEPSAPDMRGQSDSTQNFVTATLRLAKRGAR